MMNAPGAPPSSEAISLCTTCGVVAPAHGSSCAVCKKPFERPRRTLAEPGDVFWIALRCSFVCRSCAFPSPLEGIELDAGVHCAQCGAFQRFETEGWRDALAFAHEIGDLAGPHPEGRQPNPRVWIGENNPHRAIGLTETFGRKDGTIAVEASPGHPTCARCHLALDVSFEGDAVVTRCRGCHDRGRCELPAEARTFHPAVQGVVSSEHRVDRQRVKVQQTQAGLVSLLCPGCGAGVRPGEGDTIECPYCKHVAFLPARLRTRGGGDIVEAPIFWVAMRGPSAIRKALESPTGEEVTKLLESAKGILKRGLSPLPGIALAPPSRGVDMKQLSLTVGLTALAVTIGAVLVTLAE